MGSDKDRERDWKIEPPPKNTVVLARYDFEREFSEVLTCKRGCCVYGIESDLGPQRLPRWWKPAADAASRLEGNTEGRK